MHALVQSLQYLNLAAFAILAVACARLWLRRRDPASFWALAMFVVLTAVSIVGRVQPAHPHGLGEASLLRALIALLLLFPYLLYRFTTTFERPPRNAERALMAMTVVMLVWTFAQPTYPAAGDPRPPSFIAYLIGFLVHWTVLSSYSAWRLWRVGRGQPSVPRRRMRLLAGAASTLTLALFVTAAAGGARSPAQAAAQALAFVSMLAFLLGFAPPAALRLVWRRPEQRRIQQAVESLVSLATTREEIAERVLEPLRATVGAEAVALRTADGSVLAARNVPDETLAEVERGETPPGAITLGAPGGTLLVWASPYAPFFGDEELDALRSVAALTWIAVDRVRLFVQERDARVALERANEVMTNFVALAAHELRTPVTSIHGFVRTLNHLGDRLTTAQREEISRTLEQQTARMALLVEQLLDLSRLDADAIEIVPQRLPVRERVAELLLAAGVPADTVAVEVPDDLESEIDPQAFDRIVSNLVTNAFRYGRPPVSVRAEQVDRHLRLWVEDRGSGVPDEFVPNLFERFTRSDEPRDGERAAGTGLGLAIARAYARAHGGDLLYESAEPHGARFHLVLPAGS